MEQIENYVQELNNNSQAGEQIPQERSVMEQQFWGAPRLRQWCGGRLLAPAAHMSSGSLCLPPARMHFCVLQARRRRPSGEPGAARPRNIALNPFIPALVNRSVGSPTGTTGLDGHGMCDLDVKKSMKASRTRPAGHSGGTSIEGPTVAVAAIVDARKEERWMAAVSAGKTLVFLFLS